MGCRASLYAALADVEASLVRARSDKEGGAEEGGAGRGQMRRMRVGVCQDRCQWVGAGVVKSGWVIGLRGHARRAVVSFRLARRELRECAERQGGCSGWVGGGGAEGLVVGEAGVWGRAGAWEVKAGLLRRAAGGMGGGRRAGLCEALSMLGRHEEAVHECRGRDMGAASRDEMQAFGRSLVEVGRGLVKDGEGRKGAGMVREALRLDEGRGLEYEGEAWEVMCKASREVGGGGARMGEVACLRAVELDRFRATDTLTWAKGERRREAREKEARERMGRERREREVMAEREMARKKGMEWKEEQGDGTYLKGGTGSYGKRDTSRNSNAKGGSGGGQGGSKKKAGGPRGLYDVLGVQPDSDRSLVKKAYHELAIKVSILPSRQGEHPPLAPHDI